ncbi:MAG: methyltransferase domain-containing protein [Anaerolineae bacterium]|nr:methyltransferase domain-containing protein [Anaerolineae bacterium]MDW8173868.1 methyltransferase domain-containing protein [Anaerolineae bacterium]
MTVQDYDARYFESRFTPSAERDGIWREIAAYLQARYIPASAAVLDMGAGYCSFINHVRAAQRFALDLFPQVGQYAALGVEALVGSCTNLSRFADTSLDVVFASNLLEHLTRPDIEATLNEVRRVLRFGGYLILIQPNFRYCSREYFDDYTHLQIFTHVSLSDWLTAVGLRVVQQEPRFLPFSFKSRLPKWPWLARLYLRLPYRPLAKQMLIVAQK